MTLALDDANWQSGLGFEGELHVVGKEVFEFGGAQVGAGGDLDDGEVGFGGDEALGGEGAGAFRIGAERGGLGAAAGEGVGDVLRPVLMEGSGIALEEVDLAEEGDGRLSVVRAGVEEVGAEFQNRVAVGAERVAQRAEIDELEDIARDGARIGIARITAGGDETNFAIRDGGFIAAPDAILAGETRFEAGLVEAAVQEGKEALGGGLWGGNGPDQRGAEEADGEACGHGGDGTGEPGDVVLFPAGGGTDRSVCVALESLVAEAIMKSHRAQLSVGEDLAFRGIIAHCGFEHGKLIGREHAILIAHEQVEKIGVVHGEASFWMRERTQSPRVLCRRASA